MFCRINSSVVGPDTSLFNSLRTEEETSPMLHANDGGARSTAAEVGWLVRACQIALKKQP